MSNKAQKRKLHNGRGPAQCELDQEVFQRITDVERGVSGLRDKQLLQVARGCAERLGLIGFKASRSWLRGWKGRYQVRTKGRNQNEIPRCNVEIGNGTKKVENIPPHKLSFLTESDKVGVVTLSPTNMSEALPATEVEGEEVQVYFDYSTPEHNYAVTTPLHCANRMDMDATPTSLQTHMADILEGVAFLQSQEGVGLTHDDGGVGLDLTLGEEVEVGGATEREPTNSKCAEIQLKDATMLNPTVLNQHILPVSVFTEYSGLNHTPSHHLSLDSKTTTSVFSSVCISSSPSNHSPSDFPAVSHTPFNFNHASSNSENHFPSVNQTSDFPPNLASSTHLAFPSSNHASSDHTHSESSDFSTVSHTNSILDEQLMSMFNHRSFLDPFPCMSPALIGSNWSPPSDAAQFSLTGGREEESSSSNALGSAESSSGKPRKKKYKKGKKLILPDSKLSSKAEVNFPQVMSPRYHTRSRVRTAARSFSVSPSMFLESSPPPVGLLASPPLLASSPPGGLLANRRSQPVFPDEPEIVFHEIQLGPLHTTPIL